LKTIFKEDFKGKERVGWWLGTKGGVFIEPPSSPFLYLATGTLVQRANKRPAQYSSMPDLQKPAQPPSGKDDDDCKLKQLTMFDCDRESLENKGIVKCYPIPRVFRMWAHMI
jgi:Mitochondrial export protein Som1